MKIATIAIAAVLLIAAIIWIIKVLQHRSKPRHGSGLRANMEEMHEDAPFKRRD